MVGQQTTSVHLDVHPYEEEEYLGICGQHGGATDNVHLDVHPFEEEEHLSVHEQHGGTTDNVHLDVHPFEEEEGPNSLTLLQLEDLVEQFHSVESTSSLFLQPVSLRRVEEVELDRCCRRPHPRCR